MADNDRIMVQGTAGPSRSSQRGTALIEFTLILPMLLVLTVAAVDFGRAFYVKNVAEQAAREGVRLRAVTSTADSALVRTRVMDVLDAANVTMAGLAIAGALQRKLIGPIWLEGKLVTEVWVGDAADPAAGERSDLRRAALLTTATGLTAAACTIAAVAALYRKTY